MPIHKTDLETYFIAKFAKRREDLRKPAREEIKQAVTAALKETLKKEAAAERLAQAFYDYVHTNFDVDKLPWSHISALNVINDKFLGWRESIIMSHTNTIYHNICHKGTDKLPDILIPTFTELKEKLSDTVNTFKALEQLEKEINAVMAGARSGDKAYKILLDLGVDMSDFIGAGTNVPAIYKLSVDPYHLQGNCVS